MAYLVNSSILINDNRELIGVNTAGINTALYVGGNIQLDADSGIITATSFAGSGANLTDIDAQVLVSDGIPTGISTSEGDLYYDSTDLTLFTYYDNNWVEASPVPPGATNLEVTNEAGITTASIDLLTETLVLSGTAGEVEVGVNSTTKTLQIGLTNDVAIGGSMTAGSFYGDGSNLDGIGLDPAGFYEVAGIQAGIVTVSDTIDLNGNIVGNFTNLVSGISTIQTVDLTVNSLGTLQVNDIEATDTNSFIDFKVGASKSLALRLGSDLNPASSLYHQGEPAGAGTRISTQDDGIRLTGLIQIGQSSVTGAGASEQGLRFGFGSSGQIVSEISTDLSGTNLDTELVTALAVETALDSVSAALVTSADEQSATDYPMPFLSAVGAGASIYTDSTTNEEFTYNPSTGILKVKEFDALSDARLKTDIVRIDDALGKVAQLRGVEYDWKNGSGSSVGVIAQEVQEVYPQLVNDSGERLTVNYNGLVGLLIAAVNEMSVELAELKAQK